MGQDIHLFVEAIGIDGEWHHIAGPGRSGQFSHLPRSQDLPVRPSFLDGSWWELRNYAVNTVLCPSGGRLTVDAALVAAGIPERGLPEDLTDEVRAKVDDYGAGGHSHSWMTVGEARHIPYPSSHDWWAWWRCLEAIEFYCGDSARLVFFLDN